MQRLAVWLVLLLSFFGLSDSAYLAKGAITGDPLICNIENLSGCNIVAQSPYSQLFGIPLADFGLVFYGLLFILAAVEILYRFVHVRRAIQGIAALGLIASAYFMFIQLSIINALCIYCIASAGITFLIFILSYFIEPLAPKGSPLKAPPWSPPSRERLIIPPPLT